MILVLEEIKQIEVKDDLCWIGRKNWIDPPAFKVKMRRDIRDKNIKSSTIKWFKVGSEKLCSGHAFARGMVKLLFLWFTNILDLLISLKKSKNIWLALFVLRIQSNLWEMSTRCFRKKSTHVPVNRCYCCYYDQENAKGLFL